MFLLVSNFHNNNEMHGCVSALGHEIHISRYLVCDMLKNNYINEEDTIVTIYEDRKFLYSKLFKNVLTLDEFNKLNIDKDYVINIYYFMLTLLDDHKDKNLYLENFKKKNNYPIEYKLFTKMERNFNDLLSMIDYPNLNSTIVKLKKYIVIHHRIIKSIKSNNDENLNKIITNKIIQFIRVNYKDYDIVLFSNSPKNIFDDDNLVHTQKLDEYASYMNNEKCICVITELSGGGEFAQYCHSNQIYQYYNSYKNNCTTEFKIDTNQNIPLRNGPSGLTFNMKGITDATVYRFNNYENMLNKILTNIKKC